MQSEALYVFTIAIESIITLPLNSLRIFCLMAVAFWMKQFGEENRVKFLETLHLFLRSGAESFSTLSKPKGLEDSKLVRVS